MCTILELLCSQIKHQDVKNTLPIKYTLSLCWKEIDFQKIKRPKNQGDFQMLVYVYH